MKIKSLFLIAKLAIGNYNERAMKTTKEKIYLAEFKQFSEKIASELAISKPALYQHFTSKLDFFEK